MLRNEAAGRLSCSLPIERCEKCIAQFVAIARYVIELTVPLPWKACWGHVEEADLVNLHCSM